MRNAQTVPRDHLRFTFANRCAVARYSSIQLVQRRAARQRPDSNACPRSAKPSRESARSQQSTASAAAALSSTTSACACRSAIRPARRADILALSAGVATARSAMAPDGERRPQQVRDRPVDSRGCARCLRTGGYAIRAGRRQLVQVAVAVQHQRGVAPSAPSTWAIVLRQLGIEHADDLVRGAGRIRQRAEHVEDGALPDFAARPAACFMAGWNFGANKKPMPTSSMHLAHLLRRQIEVDPQRGQHIGAAALAMTQRDCRASPPFAPRPR